MTRNKNRNASKPQKVIEGKKQNPVPQAHPLLEEKSLFELFESVIKYIENNLKAVTWLATVVVVIMAEGLKFICYALDAGKLAYWKIDYSAISNMNENTLYNILLTLSFSLVVIFFILIPYAVLKIKWSWKRKIICFVALYIGLAVVFFVGLKAWIIIKDFAWIGFLAYLFVVSICYGFYLVPSLLLHFCGRLDNRRQLTEKNFVVSVCSISACDMACRIQYICVLDGILCREVKDRVSRCR